MKPFALSVLLLAGSAGSARAVDGGFYLGAGYGRADYADGLAGQLRSAYAGRSDYAVESAALTDRNDQAWKLTLGYRFLPWLGVELSYADAGEAASTYVLVPKPLLNSGPVSARGRYELEGTSLALVGEWPLGPAFAVSLRAGVVDSQLRYREVSRAVNGDTFPFRGPNDRNTGALAGLGLAWRLAPQWDLRLDWDRWFDVGTRFDVQDDTNGRFGHVDRYTVNLLYRFDR